MSSRPEDVAPMGREFDPRRLHVWLHAQGGRAIEAVLDTYSTVLSGSPGNPRRHRIEHGGSLFAPLAARAAALGIAAAAQPGMLSVLGDGLAEALPERSDDLVPYGAWQRAGVRG